MKISLYLHFPFCVRKCQYCDFLSAPGDERTRARYRKALEREIRSWNLNRRLLTNSTVQTRSMLRIDSEQCESENDQLQVDTIFFGGGTPSLMSPEQLSSLMTAIRETMTVDPDAEITLECNPGTVDEEKLRAFRKAGINRLSMGVQSFRDEELRLLGRIHTAEEAENCVRDARKAGFQNISIDLMSALPGQTYEEWMYSLEKAVSLQPEHISAYSLILEDGTPLKRDYEAGKLPEVPDEDLDRKMYHDTKTFLAGYGYHRYEISNYAKDGFESRHNSGYWMEHPYLGVGLGAASYFVLRDGRRIRWNDTRDFEKYCGFWEQAEPETCGKRKKTAECMMGAHDSGDEEKSWVYGEEGCRDSYDGFDPSNKCDVYENFENLSTRDQMAEFMFLGLRRMEGVSARRFAERFGTTLEDVYGDVIRRYLDLGFLLWHGDRLALTDHGIDVSNTVMADFL